MTHRFLVSVVLGAALMFAATAASADDVYRNPAGHVPPGLEKQGKVPPGQAKKDYRDDRRDRRYDGDRRHDRDDRRYDGDRRRDRDGKRYEGDRRQDRDDKRYDGDRRRDRDHRYGREGKRD